MLSFRHHLARDLRPAFLLYRLNPWAFNKLRDVGAAEASARQPLGVAPLVVGLEHCVVELEAGEGAGGVPSDFDRWVSAVVNVFPEVHRWRDVLPSRTEAHSIDPPCSAPFLRS